MRPGDLDDKPYAKFYRPQMAPLPESARDALARGAVAEPLLPGLDLAPRLLNEGYAEIEDGFTVRSDGGISVAVRTEMPGVTPRMVDFWFGWHSAEPQRYKLWHPRAHVHAEWGAPEPKGKQGRELYVGRTSYVDEYIGSMLNHVAISFLPPQELGFDEEALRDPDKATVVCARIDLLRPKARAGFLVHHVRRIAGGGSEMRSRFWLGGGDASLGLWPLFDAVAVRAARLVFPLDAESARELLVHCVQEMGHLATFLPALYSELA